MGLHRWHLPLANITADLYLFDNFLLEFEELLVDLVGAFINQLYIEVVRDLLHEMNLLVVHSQLIFREFIVPYTVDVLDIEPKAVLILFCCKVFRDERGRYRI